MMRLLLSLLLLSSAAVTGCSPWSTFPSDGSTSVIEYPELPPIPGLIARALGRVHDLEGRDGPVVFNLPADSPYHLFTKVRRELGEDSVMQMTPDQEAVHLSQIRLRATDAEVDVTSRGSDGVPVVTTLSFSRAVFGGWQLERTRVWRIRATIPEPGYPVAEERHRLAMERSARGRSASDEREDDAESNGPNQPGHDGADSAADDAPAPF